MMIQYFDISKWTKLQHLNTGGTRDKFIAISPDGNKYYFKTSLKREKRDYKYEFWSEIIAYYVGKSLDFNVVRYDIASHGQTIGCLSKSIIDGNKEEHHEGYRYIIQKYPDFTINYKNKHSFQYIISSLTNIGLGHLKQEVIKMIVFDAIIGNTDRHSENWALILNKDIRYGKYYNFIENYYKKNFLNRIQDALCLFLKTGKTVKSIRKLQYKKNFNFSPLYDNGSSLGRELSDNKITNLLKDANQMDSYINKGYSDIRWNDKKLNLIELVKTIELDNKSIVNDILYSVKYKYSRKKIEEILTNIDNNVPPLLSQFKIPLTRKQFIVEYIDLRVCKLLELLNETENQTYLPILESR